MTPQDMTPQEMIKTLMLAGWTQAGIARYANTTQTTVSRAATGASTPRYKFVDSLRTLLEKTAPINREKERTTDWSAPSNMNLRDYFAAKAIQGVLSKGLIPYSLHESYAEISYEIADAMLKARGENK